MEFLVEGRRRGLSIGALQARRAANSSTGSQLGLSRWAAIQWLSRRGMRWEGLLPALFQQQATRITPHVLVIHLGGNDLGLIQGKALLIQACSDMQLIRQRWPGVRLIWSDILPRREWRGVWDPRAIDRARKMVNRRICLALLLHGGLTIPHSCIRHRQVELYRADGIHLSDTGNDIFLGDLQGGLREVVCAMAARFVSIVLQVLQSISNAIINARDMLCPKENIEAETLKDECPEQAHDIGILGCKGVNHLNSGHIIAPKLDSRIL
ncbi:uncharacterized protein LOC133386091 [Rhineura floridana]|uniref:uncharacterized protein LOC133386091 n=1 Tax=Rhineura floridana TaxID=261503 RepID=UPI002AC815FD|nr:uncharacterized protein LOC133386091 [Rhineura floridana]